VCSAVRPVLSSGGLRCGLRWSAVFRPTPWTVFLTTWYCQLIHNEQLYAGQGVFILPTYVSYSLGTNCALFHGPKFNGRVQHLVESSTVALARRRPLNASVFGPVASRGVHKHNQYSHCLSFPLVNSHSGVFIFFLFQFPFEFCYFVPFLPNHSRKTTKAFKISLFTVTLSHA